MFSSEFGDIFKNTCFGRTTLVDASGRSTKKTDIWEEVFKNGSSKTCERQPLKKLKGYCLPKADYTPSNFLEAVFHKFYLTHS